MYGSAQSQRVAIILKSILEICVWYSTDIRWLWSGREKRQPSTECSRIAFFLYAYCCMHFPVFRLYCMRAPLVCDQITAQWHDNKISFSSNLLFLFLVVVVVVVVVVVAAVVAAAVASFYSLPPKITYSFDRHQCDEQNIHIYWLRFVCSCCLLHLAEFTALLLCYISRSKSVWHKVHAAAKAYRSR